MVYFVLIIFSKLLLPLTLFWSSGFACSYSYVGVQRDGWWPDFSCFEYFNLHDRMLPDINVLCENKDSTERKELFKYKIDDVKGCILVQLNAIKLTENGGKIFDVQNEDFLLNMNHTFGKYFNDYPKWDRNRTNYIKNLMAKGSTCSEEFEETKLYPSSLWTRFFKCLEEVWSCGSGWGDFWG